MGQINPRTGDHAVSGRFQLTDRVFVLGDIDVTGEYRGLLKYLIRFR